MKIANKWKLQDPAISGDGGDGASAGAQGSEQTQAAGGVAQEQGGQSQAAQGQQPSEKPEQGKAYWPDDWRQKWAGADEKKLTRLSRFASPEAVFDSYIAAENKIRSGELKSVLPKDAKPEEVAQWRKDNGIPEAPDKYDLKFDSGLVIGEEDKPIIDEFLKSAHGANYTPEQAKGAIEWWYKDRERQVQTLQTKDSKDKDATLDALNAEWGKEFRTNMNMIDGVLAQFPEDVRDELKGGRLPDGTAIFNHPGILRAFASIAREINPAGTLVPGGGGDPAKGVDDEIAGIEKTMRENRAAYNRDEKMQARYRELLVAREKLSARK